LEQEIKRPCFIAPLLDENFDEAKVNVCTKTCNSDIKGIAIMLSNYTLTVAYKNFFSAVDDITNLK